MGLAKTQDVLFCNFGFLQYMVPFPKQLSLLSKITYCHQCNFPPHCLPGLGGFKFSLKLAFVMVVSVLMMVLCQSSGNVSFLNLFSIILEIEDLIFTFKKKNL